MATSKNTIAQTPIANLSRSLASVYQRAEVTGHLDEMEADALRTVIAITPATNRRDAAMQVVVAQEIAELVRHGLAPADRIGLVAGALSSASRMLTAKRQAA